MRFFLLCIAITAAGQTFQSGSTGVDGDLDLSTANPGLTLLPRTSGLDLDGDNIFHFRNINIPAGKILYLKAENLRLSGPVHFLASGTVNIAGEIRLEGENAISNLFSFQQLRAKPGPGGYPGGPAGAFTSFSHLSPAWIQLITNTTGVPNCVASHAVDRAGSNQDYLACGGSRSYGSATLNPLTGGSGGGLYRGFGGGAGGGAIRIRAASISLSGRIYANGGNGIKDPAFPYCSGSGSGGSILIQADQLSLNNALLDIRGGICPNPLGGTFPPLTDNAIRASQGRYRLEANTSTGSASVDTHLNSFNDLSETAVVSLLSTVPHNELVPDVRIVQINGMTPINPDVNIAAQFLSGTSFSSAPLLLRVDTRNVPLLTPVFVKFEFTWSGWPNDTRGFDFPCGDLLGTVSSASTSCFIPPSFLTFLRQQRIATGPTNTEYSIFSGITAFARW